MSFLSARFVEHLKPAYVAAFEDRISEVRAAASQTVAGLCDAFGLAWVMSNVLTEVRLIAPPVVMVRWGRSSFDRIGGGPSVRFVSGGAPRARETTTRFGWNRRAVWQRM